MVKCVDCKGNMDNTKDKNVSIDTNLMQAITFIGYYYQQIGIDNGAVLDFYNRNGYTDQEGAILAYISLATRKF